MKTIIFLPGLGCDERSFAHQIKTLKNKFNTKVIVCDAHNNMAGHIKSVLDSSPEKIILIGHSFGGWVAQWIAIHAPERVEKLILLGTATGKLTPDLKTIFEEMLANFKNNKHMEFFDNIRAMTIHPEKANNKDLLSLIKKMQIDFSHKGLINQVLTDLEGKDTTEHLKNIQCETLLIHGKQDAFYQEEMAILKNIIPNNTAVTIDQCGHMLTIEQPEAVSNLIDLWLV